MADPSRALVIRVSAIAVALLVASAAAWGLTIYLVAKHLAPACDEAMDIRKVVIANTAGVAAAWASPILVAAAAIRVPGRSTTSRIASIVILVLAQGLGLLFPLDEFNFTLSPLDIDCDKRMGEALLPTLVLAPLASIIIIVLSATSFFYRFRSSH